MPIQTKWKSLQDFFGLHPVQIVSKETTLKSCVFKINGRIFQQSSQEFHSSAGGGRGQRKDCQSKIKTLWSTKMEI